MYNDFGKGIRDMLTFSKSMNDMLAFTKGMNDTLAFTKGVNDAMRTMNQVHEMNSAIKELSRIHDNTVFNPGKWIRDMKMATDSHAFALSIAQQATLPKDIFSVINSITTQQNSIRQQLDAIRMINSIAFFPSHQFEKSLLNTLTSLAKSKAEKDAKIIESVLQQVADITEEAESTTDVMSFLKKINACAKVITDGIQALTKNETFSLLLLLYIIGEKVLTGYGLALQINTPPPPTKQELRAMTKEELDSSDAKNTYFVARKIDTLEGRLKEDRNTSDKQLKDEINKNRATFSGEDSSSIYSEPSDTSAVKGTIMNGQEVIVCRKRANFWDIDLVNDNGMITSGWIHKKHLKIIK